MHVPESRYPVSYSYLIFIRIRIFKNRYLKYQYIFKSYLTQLDNIRIHSNHIRHNLIIYVFDPPKRKKMKKK
jgi:hypothetical protein